MALQLQNECGLRFSEKVKNFHDEGSKSVLCHPEWTVTFSMPVHHLGNLRKKCSDLDWNVTLTEMSPWKLLGLHNLLLYWLPSLVVSKALDPSHICWHNDQTITSKKTFLHLFVHIYLAAIHTWHAYSISRTATTKTTKIIYRYCMSSALKIENETACEKKIITTEMNVPIYVSGAEVSLCLVSYLYYWNYATSVSAYHYHQQNPHTDK